MALNQLKPSELYIVSCGKGLSTANNVEMLGLYPLLEYKYNSPRVTFGLTKVYFRLCKVADTPFHSQYNAIYSLSFKRMIE